MTLYSGKITSYFLIFGFMYLIFLEFLSASRSDDFILYVKNGMELQKVDYEGEVVNKTVTESDKHAWYWEAWDTEGYNMLVSRAPYYGRRKLMTKSRTCTNDSFLRVQDVDSSSPWHLWTVFQDGTIRSKCGPGWRLRKVGNWIKLINDEPCKVSPDDIFKFVKRF